MRISDWSSDVCSSDLRRLAASLVRELVVAEARNRGHLRARLQVRLDRRHRRERHQVVAHNVGARRHGLRLGLLPAGLLEQPAGGLVDVVAPGGEDLHMAPVQQRRADALPSLQHEGAEAALDEMRRSSEADRAGANDNNGKIGAGHGIHSSVLPASWNCGSKKEITQRVATSLALPTQPLSAQHSSARSEEHTSELQSLMRISYAVF